MSLEISDIDNHLANYPAPRPAGTLSDYELRVFNLCGIWQKVRPIIKFAKKLLFFKPLWQAVVEEFVDICDGLCNGKAMAD